MQYHFSYPMMSYLSLMLNRKSTLDIVRQIFESSNKQRDTEELLHQDRGQLRLQVSIGVNRTFL